MVDADQLRHWLRAVIESVGDALAAGSYLITSVAVGEQEVTEENGRSGPQAGAVLFTTAAKGWPAR
jgi:hypothetical protein